MIDTVRKDPLGTTLLEALVQSNAIQYNSPAITSIFTQLKTLFFDIVRNV